MANSARDWILTDRLILRRPVADDAPEIFARYASDARVVRYVGWPRHRNIDDTRVFLAAADEEWSRWPAGPYVIEARDTGELIGGTGLLFETRYRAATGYVLAADAWGRGFATEALGAMIDIGRELAMARLYALCHVDHKASAHVLDKRGFTQEGVLRRHSEFPNLEPPGIYDVFCYGLVDFAPLG